MTKDEILYAHMKEILQWEAREEDLTDAGADLRALAVAAVCLLIGLGHDDTAPARALEATVEAWDRAVAATEGAPCDG